MTAAVMLSQFSLLCHLAVFAGRTCIFGATAWGMIYSRPARISFLSNLPRPMQPVVADLFGTVWIYAAVCMMGGVSAVTRYLPGGAALLMTAANAGGGAVLAIHLVRLVRMLPAYVRERP